MNRGSPAAARRLPGGCPAAARRGDGLSGGGPSGWGEPLGWREPRARVAGARREPAFVAAGKSRPSTGDDRLSGAGCGAPMALAFWHVRKTPRTRRSAAERSPTPGVAISAAERRDGRARRGCGQLAGGSRGVASGGSGASSRALALRHAVGTALTRSPKGCHAERHAESGESDQRMGRRMVGGSVRHGPLFAAAAFTGLVLVGDEADYALPMAAAAAVGSGLGGAYRVLRPKRKKAPAWPVTAAPPGVSPEVV